jgi:hypothetical protein
MTGARRAGLFRFSFDGRGRGEGGEGIIVSVPLSIISIFEFFPLPVDGARLGRGW